MSETIRTVKLTDNEAIVGRDIAVDSTIDSIDVNQIDGSIVTAESNSDGQYLGRITIYPQNWQLPTVNPTYLTSIPRGGYLNYTLDARFNHVRRKIWIADTGNHRVIKLNRDTYDTDLIVDDMFYYPYALSVNFNNGGVFIKAYADLDREEDVLYYLRSNGEAIVNFKFGRDNLESSSSSSSESADSSSSSTGLSDDSSSSSSGVFVPPPMPSSRSMAFDYVRSRLWWVDGKKVYLFDVRGKQVNSYNLGAEGYAGTRTIDVDLNTGNSFVIASDVNDEWFLIQMNRDNNKFLGFVAV